MVSVALTLIVLVAVSFLSGRLWQRYSEPRRRPRGRVLFSSTTSADDVPPPIEEPVEVVAPPERPRTLRLKSGLIVAIGLLLWFAIDSVVWYLRPSLPPSVQSLEGVHEQITSAHGIEALPTLSPDGSWIAYRSDAEGTGDIYVRRVGSDEPSKNLTRDLNAEESDPVFSPDGLQIAFKSTYQNGGIYLIHRDGGAVSRLTNFGASPAWTPNGRAIVFATRSSVDPRAGAPSGDLYLPSGVRSGGSEGWIVNIESRVVFRLARGDFRQPAVSPDGKRVAYWSAAQPPADSRPRRDGGIWTITLDGRSPMSVTAPGAIDWSPVWSSDGEFLYFLSDRGGRVGIWRIAMHRSSGGPQGPPVAMALQAERAASLAIARDGRHLAWSTAEWSPTVMRIDYDADTRSTKGAPATLPPALPLRCAEPSPDGVTLAAASDRQQSDIYLVPLDGRPPRAVTKDEAEEGCPRWSADGARLAFHSNAGGRSRIWIANADGSALRVAASAIGDLTHPVWSPDGNSIVAWDAYHHTMRMFSSVGEGPGETLPSPPHRFIPVTWSPDGSRIAGNAAGAVWLYHMAGGTFERLLPGAGPAWLSGSRRMIVASEGRLILVDVPTRFTREILSLPDLHLDSPILSADDRHLYFSRNAPESNVWMATLK